MSRQGSRQVQHRPPREPLVKPSVREVELERELRKLTQQLARTRKRLQKAEDRLGSLVEDEASPTPADAPEPLPGPDNTCPKGCGPLARLDLGARVYLICKECRYRRSVETRPLG